MIVPSNVDSLSKEELIEVLINEIGYDEGAARYVATQLKDHLADDQQINL